MPKAHSILGASSSHRWLSCPGSVRLSKGIPRTSSTYADEGTAAHELAEMCLRNNTNTGSFIGGLITVNETAYEVTEEMAEAVQLYLDTVRGDLEEAGKGAELKVEHRFNLDWLYDGMFGTNDALVGQPFGLLQVYDFKYGAGVAVDVVNNPQLMYYALGAAKGDAFEEIELVIVQPRANHPDGPVRRVRLWPAELFRWAEVVLLPGAEDTEREDAPLNTGSHCRFCPALAVCPAQKEKALSVAKEAFSQAQPPAPEALGVTELKKIVDAADMVEAWMSACRSHLKHLLETGSVTPDQAGYKLVAGRAARKWADEGDAVAIMEMLGIDPYEQKIKSPAQAEKQAKKGAFDSVITSTRGTQMVPLSDKREAIQMIANVFGEVDID